MRKVTISIVALVVLAALCAVPSVASAEEGGNPTIVPEPTEATPLFFISTSTKPHLELVDPVFKVHFVLECEAGLSEAEFISKRSGKATFKFTGCKSGTSKCTSLGAMNGVIELWNINIHLVAFKNAAAELRLGLVLALPANLRVTCGETSHEWHGSVIGEVDGAGSGKGLLTEKVKTLKLLFHQTEGAQKLTQCELDKEFCFEGETPKKFAIETTVLGSSSQEAWEREDPITLSSEVAFAF